MFHKLLFVFACLVAFPFILPAPSALAADQVVTNCSNDDELRTKLGTMQGTGGGGIPTKDQRGFSRPQGSANDKGAVEVCTIKPAKPTLLLPASNSQVPGAKHLLKWAWTDCAERFNLVVRLGSQSGAVVLSKTNLTNNSAKTPKLTKGNTYYWHVTGVNTKGTKPSAWFKFKIQ